MGIQTVRPENRREFMSKLLEPAYYPQAGGVPQPFSEPAKLGQPENNRAYQVSSKGGREKEFYIGIKDIDEAVMYYFTEVIRPTVIQNNTKLNVPVIYGTPENWKSVQVDGYYRDENGKLMAPLIMFKRASITQNRNLGNKLDGNLIHNVQLFETRFNNRNFYSNFNVLNSRAPEKKYVVSITPDYVTVEYECIVWTYFVEQMDKLIESLNFASRSYWGDPNRFQFYSSIESFEDAITYNLGENRAVRSNFRLTLNGYLIPDTVNKKLANTNIYYGVSEIIFGVETATGTEEFVVKTSSPSATTIKSVTLTDSINNVNNITNVIVPAEVLTYLNTNKSVTGSYISPESASFAADWLVAPLQLNPTSIDNFDFFINSTYIEKVSINSWTVDGMGNSYLVVDTGSLGFGFNSDDLITAIGKFM
jgi:hypothetical protein